MDDNQIEAKLSYGCMLVTAQPCAPTSRCFGSCAAVLDHDPLSRQSRGAVHLDTLDLQVRGTSNVQIGFRNTYAGITRTWLSSHSATPTIAASLVPGGATMRIGALSDGFASLFDAGTLNASLPGIWFRGGTTTAATMSNQTSATGALRVAFSIFESVNVIAFRCGAVDFVRCLLRQGTGLATFGGITLSQAAMRIFQCEMLDAAGLTTTVGANFARGAVLASGGAMLQTSGFKCDNFGVGATGSSGIYCVAGAQFAGFGSITGTGAAGSGYGFAGLLGVTAVVNAPNTANTGTTITGATADVLVGNSGAKTWAQVAAAAAAADVSDFQNANPTGVRISQ